MDAIAVEDEKDVPYRSTRPGMCHACGHDVHTSILLGAGLELAARASELAGRVRLIFQPAEEAVPSGSLDVLADGVLEGVSVIYALHCDPAANAGEIGTRIGAIASAYDAIDVRLRGPGGHSARPHRTPDLVYLISRIVTDLPDSLPQFINYEPGAGAHVSFGAIHAGQARNAIPSYAEINGAVRSLDNETWQAIPKILERVIDSIVSPFDVHYEVEYIRKCPVVTNDAKATDLLNSAVAKALGETALFEAPQSIGGEDFAWYLEEIPGSLARLGVRSANDGVDDVDLHSGLFDVDERAIGIGIRVLVETALEALAGYSESS
jgi:amidohydrolase